MNENYALLAANWWSKTIQDSYPNLLIKELNSFKELLAQKIWLSNSFSGTFRISTCNKMDGLLSDVATQVRLPVAIPRGYEMKIIINSVSIYNNEGFLVENF